MRLLGYFAAQVALCVGFVAVMEGCSPTPSTAYVSLGAFIAAIFLNLFVWRPWR